MFFFYSQQSGQANNARLLNRTPAMVEIPLASSSRNNHSLKMATKKWTKPRISHVFHGIQVQKYSAHSGWPHTKYEANCYAHVSRMSILAQIANHRMATKVCFQHSPCALCATIWPIDRTHSAIIGPLHVIVDENGIIALQHIKCLRVRG